MVMHVVSNYLFSCVIHTCFEFDSADNLKNKLCYNIFFYLFYWLFHKYRNVFSYALTAHVLNAGHQPG